MTWQPQHRDSEGSLDEPLGEQATPTATVREARRAWQPWALGLLSLMVLALGAAEYNNTLRINALLDSVDVIGAKPVQSLYEQPADLGGLIASVRRSVVDVYCGDFAGTGWAIDLEAPENPEDSQRYRELPYSVVTNEHVITDCEGKPASVSIEVNGVRSAAYLENYDAKRDLALLMVKPELPGLEVGKRPEPGMWVMTIGNPLNLERAVSIGNVMQIDGYDLVNSAPLNSGNSGGPLVNSRGQVVGVSTWVGIADESDPTDAPQDWNVATTIPAFCKELIACDNDPYWTWKA